MSETSEEADQEMRLRLLADISEFGLRRRKMLAYLIEHPELDAEGNLGDLIFHLGPRGHVAWEETRRGTIRQAA